MTSRANRWLALTAVALFTAGTVAVTKFVLAWTGHGLNVSVPEPASLALAGAGLVGLSQTLVRKFGKA